MKASELFIRCFENEGVDRIFGIPGEENIDVMDVLLDSSIEFITTRHEQGAAFMADVHGRLTGRAGVCLATLGPGATNLVTGVADANMDRAPLVAIAGQAATTRMHKESHQHLDLVNLFRPITKYSAQVLDAGIVPEIVRKAFKQAEAEKPGASFIDLPENIAKAEIDHKEPLKVQRALAPVPPEEKIQQASELIAGARYPLVMAGNGVIRAGAADALVRFAETLNLPVATTFMAKGAIPWSHPNALGAVGLQAHDYVGCGFDRADVVVCVGYDMVEYHPYLWNPDRNHQIVHIDSTPAEVDEHYIVEAGLIGDIGQGLDAVTAITQPRDSLPASGLRQAIADELSEHANDHAFPIKPQKILWDLRQVLEPDDIVISDVGAHKMWIARMYQAERANTCLISNGFASMGIALPGTIGAKLVYPDRTIVAVTGDAGFLMNSQEIETALRTDTPIVILIWNDAEYGLITWHQLRHFGRPSHTDFTNPDLVAYAESFGAKGYRVEATDELVPILQQAIDDETVVVIDCPVDYAENMKLTEKLGELVCPI
jgi:acetolactate synthase-1/2/3 large subunit